jgi:hypothetical protein
MAPDHALTAENTDHAGQRRRPTSGTPQALANSLEQPVHPRLQTTARPQPLTTQPSTARPQDPGKPDKPAA